MDLNSNDKMRPVVEAIKASWKDDPCWDLHEFDAEAEELPHLIPYQAELRQFAIDTRAKWDASSFEAERALPGAGAATFDPFEAERALPGAGAATFDPFSGFASPRMSLSLMLASRGPCSARMGWSCRSVVPGLERSRSMRGTQEIQACKSATADSRVATEVKRRKGRPNGPYGVGAADKPSHLVAGHAEIAATWAATQDPRLTCTPRSGAYGVGDAAQPSGTVLGAHSVDNAPGSVADLRLGYSPRNDTYGVNSSDEPAPTVRGHHEIRQAPAAVADRRTARRQVKGTALAYDERGYVIPTHKLVRDEHGIYTLYGPPIDWKRRAMWLCIEAPDGTWHRPLTDRELAALQSFPADFVFCGPSSTTGSGTGIRKRVGNAVPVMSAYAIADQIWASLEASDTGRRCLAFTDIWVAPSELAAMLEGWDRGATLIDTFEVAA